MSEEKRRERERCILAVRRREEARFNVAIHDSPPSFPREARLNVLIVDGIFPGRRIPNVSISRLDPSSPPLLSSRCRRQDENRGLADFISVPLTSRHHFSTHGRFPRETLETLPPRGAGRKYSRGNQLPGNDSRGGIKARFVIEIETEE